MAGKFINNTQKIMIDSANDTVINILNNPYYLYSDKKGSIAQYYNINNTKSTFDEATGGIQSELGPNCPVRYNKIKDAILYGIDKIPVDLDMTENGIEASEISGEAVVLPNTFIPYAGDFFTLDQTRKPYLFRVTAVSPNTLDSGAIMYKINYVYAYPDLHGIEDQVIDNYNMMINNVGTTFKTVVKSSKYELVEKIEQYTTKLKDYYYMIFYDTKVQSFIYSNEHIRHVYDPYLTEFIIRNNILKGSTQYIYVAQQMFLPSTFGVDYDRTIFSAIEDKDIHRHSVRYIGNLWIVDQKMSLLYAYPEEYWYMEYSHLNAKLFPINIFNDLNIIDNIDRNIKVKDNILVNILIKYFNDENITDEDLKELKYLDYCSNKELFYGIPIAIYCLEKNIENLLT